MLSCCHVCLLVWLSKTTPPIRPHLPQRVYKIYPPYLTHINQGYRAIYFHEGFSPEGCSYLGQNGGHINSLPICSSYFGQQLNTRCDTMLPSILVQKAGDGKAFASCGFRKMLWYAQKVQKQTEF